MENPKTTTALVSKRKARLRPHYSGLCQVAACLCSLTATSTNAHLQIASASHAISALPLGRTKNKEVRPPETQTEKTPALHGGRAHDRPQASVSIALLLCSIRPLFSAILVLSGWGCLPAHSQSQLKPFRPTPLLKGQLFK